MKTKLLFIMLCLALTAHAQKSAPSAQEKLAREFFRVVQLDDRSAWRDFIQANFTQKLIDKQMRAKTTNDDGQGPETTVRTQDEKIDGKLSMFQMLHQDFSGAEIKSVEVKGSDVVMSVSGNDGLSGRFTFTMTSMAPIKIDAMGIQLER